MKSNLFSIIVPVYNGEKTIMNTINSVLNQSYKNFELLIVNDGSKDNTLDVIRNVKDNRIRIINQKNSGPSSARNNGISKSNGDYIIFCDSDDELMDDILSKINNILDNNKYEIVLFKAIRIKSNENICETNNRNSFLFTENDKNEMINSIYNKFLKYNDLLGFDAPWGKAISKKIIKDNNLSFDIKLYRFEDSTFCSHLYQVSKSVFFLNEYGYKYYYYENSLCNKYNKNAINIFVDGLNALKKYNIDINNFYVKCITTLTECEKMYFYNKKNKKSFGERKKEFKKMICMEPYNNAIINIRIKSLPLHYKIEVLLLKYKFIIAYMIIKRIYFIKER